MDDPCESASSFEQLGVKPSEAHRLFLAALGCKPKDYNLSSLAERAGLNTSRLWSWANGKSRWPADAWLSAMRALGAAVPEPLPNPPLSDS